MKKQGTYNSEGDKWCNKCKKYQPLADFGLNNKSNDGKDWSCSASRIKVPSEPKLNIVIPIELQNMKLVKGYQYERPDAYDIYIQNINYTRK